MLKHLPEGLTPFQDCGFARHPVLPLEGEPVQVYCRTDEVPALQLWVNETARTLEPFRLDECHYRFDMGSFVWGDRVRYQLCTASERSPIFSFEPQREVNCKQPEKTLSNETGLCIVFDSFYLLFGLEPELTVTVKTDMPPSIPACEKSSFFLKENFSLSIGKSSYVWELKRFSNQSVLQIESYRIRYGKHDGITEIEQIGRLNCQHVWGTGERFHQVDQLGSNSNGRVVEKFTQQGDQTYLPIPFFMTEAGFGCFRDSCIPSHMRFGSAFSIKQQTCGNTLSRDVYFFGSPSQVLHQFVFHTGQPVMPPDWAFGLWISANGWNCDQEVDAQLDALKRYQYPADVMVLEAWSDERTFYRWNDHQHWKKPADTVKRIREAGLHLVLWQIPIIKYEWDGEPGEALLQDEKEAIENGYCILNEDGTPYRITENWFHHSLLPDFTNPETIKWWFGKRQHLLDMGVEGFKTDGGEFLFDSTSRLFNGMNGMEAHNLYPAQYVDAYHNFLKQSGINGVTFSRADYIGAHTRPLHWAGDQLSTWSELQSQLTAGLSAGLSGLLFWGFDIGGFAGELPTAELYLRASAMACFSAIMQWHAEPRSGQFYATHEDGFVNDRSPWNLANKLGDERILDIGIYFANLRRQMKPYLVNEAKFCVENGRPMMAHLCIDFPEDEIACACNDQYMLGRKLLVAPIVQQGLGERSVYLPRGKWRQVFTDEWYDGSQTITVHCALNEISVFERWKEDE